MKELGSARLFQNLKLSTRERQGSQDLSGKQMGWSKNDNDTAPYGLVQIILLWV